jgi:hypothetical protein
LGQIQGAVLEVAAGTARGPLRKELERFVAHQVNLQAAWAGGRAAVPWNLVRDHLRAVFLSQNENEQLRAEVEMMKMNSFDTVAAFNVKFREAATAAYPQPRSADAERTLVHAYIRSLHAYDMKRKVIEHHPANLDAAMHRAEQIDSDRDQCQRLIGRREEPMEVGSVQQNAALTALQKQLENLSTNVAKLSAQQNQHQGSTVQRKRGGYRWAPDGRPICFFCDKTGHFARECYGKKNGQGQRRGNPAKPPSDQGKA